jgi:hypothetical protein
MKLNHTFCLGRIKRLILIVIIFILGIAPLHAESIVFRLTAPHYGIVHGRISMEGFGLLAEAGAPRLPSKIFYLSLDASASVQDVSFRALSRETLPGAYEIEALPPLIPMAGADAPPPDAGEFESRRNRLFRTNQSFPENPAVFLGTDTDGGNTVLKIQFAPFQYNPVQKSLVLVGEMEVRIQYTVTGSVRDALNRRPAWIDAERPAGNRLSKPFASEGRTSLLVLTSDNLKTTLEPFLFWKRCLGDTVRFVSTESVYASAAGIDRAERIRNFLRDEYFNSGITDVLLIGHTDILPVKILYPNPKNHKDSGGVPSDFYFSDLTGDWDTDHDGFPGEYGEDTADWIPEIRVGRIPCSDTTVVGTILERIIGYEKSEAGWKSTPLLIGGVSNYLNENNNAVYMKKTDGAVLMEWLRRSVFSEPPSFTLYEKEGSDPSAFECSLPLNGPNLFSAWQNGASGCVTWWMHGGFDALERKFWNADKNGNGIPDSGELGAEELISVARHPSNSAYPAVLYANACENGWPEKLSLGREMLMSGCAAVAAYSRISWYSQGWSGPADGGNASLTSYFWEAYAGRSVPFGAAVSEAQVRYLKNFGSAWQHVQNALSLMAYGDPTMSIQVRRPVSGTLAGTLILEDEIDPVNLQILLKEADRRMTPDASGRFSFGFLTGGAYVLEVTGPDVEPSAIQVSVVNGEANTVSLRVHRKPPAAPGIRLQNTALAWTVQEGFSARRGLLISNSGSAALDVTAAIDSSGSDWISADLEPRIIPPGAADSIRILVHPDLLSQGYYESSLRLRTNAFPDSSIRVPLCMTVIDTIPPAPIDDLELFSQNGDTVALVWSAPGDNKLAGRASEYEILTGGSDGGEKDTAAVLLEKLSPAPAGKREKAVLYLERLKRFRETWIMIRTLDDAGLSSESNKVKIVTTLSEVDSDRMIPEKTRLDQNYPNPFNSSTKIGFSLAKASEIFISVLDVSGRTVSQLCQKRFSEGRHEIFWNATDRDARPAPRRVYMNRFQTPDRFELRKMLLLR